MLCNLSVAQISFWAFCGGDALVCAVLTRDVAKIAANAQLGIDAGDDLVIQIEIAPIANAIH